MRDGTEGEGWFLTSIDAQLETLQWQITRNAGLKLAGNAGEASVINLGFRSLITANKRGRAGKP